MRAMRLLLLIICSVITLHTLSVADNRGTTSADFLKIGLGARSTGMGEAFTARLGDPIGAFFNPAGLSEMPITQISATHLNWIGETKYQALSYAQPVLGIGTVGASVFALHMPLIPGLDENGLDTQMLNVFDIGMQFSYARDISPLVGVQGLSTGANLKLIYRQLADLTATGVAADLGGIYEIMEKWTVGLSVLNLGYLSSFDSESETLPIIARLGTQYQVAVNQNNLITGAIDIVQSFDNTLKANIGLEYSFANIVYLRGGYKVGYDTDSFQAGLGIKYQHYSIDYAMKDMGVFGLTHFVTASVGIGRTIRTAKVDKVKDMLNQAEAEFTQSNYDKALEIVKEAVLVDPKNKRALSLKDKLDTVLKMLQMPEVPGENTGPKLNQDGQELTPDELEELGDAKPEEGQQ